MAITDNIPVTSTNGNMKAVEFRGLKIIVTFNSGEVHEFKYEYIGRVK